MAKAKKNEGMIQLDPMEWRDAMKDVQAKATKAPPAKTGAPTGKGKAKAKGKAKPTKAR